MLISTVILLSICFVYLGLLQRLVQTSFRFNYIFKPGLTFLIHLKISECFFIAFLFLSVIPL